MREGVGLVVQMEVIMHSRVAMEVQVGYLRMELQGGSPLEQQQRSALCGKFSSTGRLSITGVPGCRQLGCDTLDLWSSTGSDPLGSRTILMC